MANQDVYELVTNQIVEGLENTDSQNWRCPWDRQASFPKNGNTGRLYSGINILILWVAQMKHEFGSQEWFTYKQAQKSGGNVLRGEKGTKVIYWNFLTVPKDEDEISKSEWKKMSKAEKKLAKDQGKTKTLPLCKTYTVFNRSQCEGLPEVPVREAPATNEDILSFVREAGVKIVSGAMACYNSTKDHIAMPPLETFHSSEGYHSTLFHEVTHWTGHESRLDRDLKNRFGSEEYAMEELVAELGAAFLGAKFGVAYEGCQHPEYIKHWVSKLKEDKYAIFTAAREAKDAVAFLEERVEQGEEVEAA